MNDATAQAIVAGMSGELRRRPIDVGPLGEPLMVVGDQDDDAGDLDLTDDGEFAPRGLPPTATPAQYAEGVALIVVRDPAYQPLVIVDQHGHVIWRRHGLTHEIVSARWCGGYALADVIDAVDPA